MPAGTMTHIQTPKSNAGALFTSAFQGARAHKENIRHNKVMEGIQQQEQEDKATKMAEALKDKQFSKTTNMLAMIDMMDADAKSSQMIIDTHIERYPWMKATIVPAWKEHVKQEGFAGEMISDITTILEKDGSVSSSDILNMGNSMGADDDTIEKVKAFKKNYLSEDKAETAKATAAAAEKRAKDAAKRAETAEQRAKAEEMRKKAGELRKKAEEIRKIEKHKEDMKTGGKGTDTSEGKKRDKIFKLTLDLGRQLIAKNEGQIKKEKHALTQAVTPLLDNIHTSIKNNYVEDRKITSAGKEAFAGTEYEIISNQEYGELFRKGRGNSIENTTSFIFSGNSAGSAQGEDVGGLVNQTHVAVPKDLLETYRNVKDNLAPLLDSLTRQNGALVEIYKNQIAEINGPANDIEPLPVSQSSNNATSAPPDSSTIDQVKSADWFTGIAGAHADIVRKVILDKMKKNPGLTAEQIRQELNL